jgi:8-oxo-dGTP diphosphatase
MRFLEKTKDGGPESPVIGYFLIEIKSLFSIVLLHFGGTREAFHSHAFNAVTLWLKGRVLEQVKTDFDPEWHKWAAGNIKFTPRGLMHKILAYYRRMGALDPRTLGRQVAGVNFGEGHHADPRTQDRVRSEVLVATEGYQCHTSGNARAGSKDLKPTHPVGVSVLLTNDKNQVLLGLRKNNSGAGYLSTPGGRLEIDENLYQCAAREFFEETGAALGAVKIVAWKEHFRYNNHYIMFYAHAKLYAGTIKNCIPDKSEDWRWFDISQLNDNNCTEPADVLELVCKGEPVQCLS